MTSPRVGQTEANPTLSEELPVSLRPSAMGVGAAIAAALIGGGIQSAQAEDAEDTDSVTVDVMSAMDGV